MLYHQQAVIYAPMTRILSHLAKFHQDVDIRDRALLYLRLLTHAGAPPNLREAAGEPRFKAGQGSKAPIPCRGQRRIFRGLTTLRDSGEVTNSRKREQPRDPSSDWSSCTMARAGSGALGRFLRADQEQVEKLGLDLVPVLPKSIRLVGGPVPFLTSDHPRRLSTEDCN